MVRLNKKRISTLSGFVEEGLIKSDQEEELEEVVDHFSISITEEMSDAIDKEDPQDPLARQFVPSREELKITPEELADPTGDERYSPIKGIVHRYRDRCLFLPITTCAVYCRFCFRREKVGAGQKGLNRRELEAAFAYLARTSDLREVILTGGDPLTIAPKLLKEIIFRTAKIKHIKFIRLHSRVPVVAPDLIDQTVVDLLKVEKPVYICVHANHPKEFTEKARKAIALFVDNGIPLLSQSVLLEGVNADVETLKELMYAFVENRIKPYYLHHGDFAKGTSHFRTTIKKGQQLLRELRGDLSGICQPTHVLDIPGGYGKVPISHNYLDDRSSKEEESWIVEDCQGEKHCYPPMK